MKKLGAFLKSVGQEMKLVEWPTMKQNRHDTWTVIATSLLYAVFFAVIDWGLSSLITNFIVK